MDLERGCYKMISKKEAEKALYNIWKETSISKYKTIVKPNMDIVFSFLDKNCVWKNKDDFYESECGFTFQFSDDRDCVTDYNFLFCPKCGGKIHEFERVENE